MGNNRSSRNYIEPVRYAQQEARQNIHTQVFVLNDGSVLLCRNGNQFVQYSAKHSVARQIHRKYHLDQK